MYLAQFSDFKNSRGLMNIPKVGACPEGAGIDLIHVMELNSS